MDAGVRGVRGPDWQWADQDGGQGHVGTLVKPGVCGREHMTVVGRTVFVRWDNGNIANYRIAERHDLRILSSACSGNCHSAVCDMCHSESIIGTRWKCSVCNDYDLCDYCYHHDCHDVNHPFLRYDIQTSKGVLVPARSDSEKVEVKGIYPGARVVRIVEDWVLGQQYGCNEGTVGTVVSDDESIDGNETDPSSVAVATEAPATPSTNSLSLTTVSMAVTKTTARTLEHTVKDQGHIRVKWDSNEHVVEHRCGVDGKVDVWSVDCASGGQFYLEHLPLLDYQLMAINDSVRPATSKTSDDSTNCDSASQSDSDDEHVQITSSYEGLLANAIKNHVLRGNARFQQGDRVQVCVDPDVFKQLQDEEHGGWNEEMALYTGLTGRVQGVQFSGNVLVIYKDMNNKKWVVNPDALCKQKWFVGDAVQILPDEALVRKLQKGHGGWVYKMKCIIGKVGEVVQVISDDVLKIRVDKLDWTLNAACCKLTSPETNEDKDSDVDSDDAETFMSHLTESHDIGKLLSSQLLLESAAKNQIGLVHAILAQNPDQVNAKSKDRTALHAASLSGHLEVVKILLEKGADVLATDKDGHTPIHYAAYNDHADVLEVLLAKDESNANVVNYNLHTPLHLAVVRQSFHSIEMLLRYTATVNAQDDNGNTALHCAIEKQYHPAIDLMVRQADVDFTVVNNRGFNVLHHAACAGNAYAVEQILSHAPSHIVNIQKDDGFTALHIASLNGYLNIAELLITQGHANIELTNAEQHTPLLTGLSQGRASIIELLVSHGANVNAVDSEGSCALHWILHLMAGGRASERLPDDMFDAIQITLIYSELPDTLPDRQWVAVACFLVQHGASLYLSNNRHMTPINLVVNDAVRTALVSASQKRT
jgi:E3 ubiquitin-protein ligase mind-bomb